VNGEFREAVYPDVEGNDYVYTLDTKAAGLEDGETTLKVILYQNREKVPYILNESEIKVIVDNYTSIKYGDEGLYLRYKFTPNTELAYAMEYGQKVQTLTQTQATAPVRPTDLGQDSEKVRLIYAIHGVFGKEAIMSIQPRPEKDKDYAWLTVTGDTEPKKWKDYQMAPWFMRLTDTGREVYSGVPFYFPMEGTGGSYSKVDLYAFMPLPVLPEEPQKPGGPAWQSAIMSPTVSLEDPDKEKKFFNSIPANARVEGFEWYRGRPCARVSMAIDQNLAALRAFGTGDSQASGATPLRLQLSETYFLDLQRGRIVHWEQQYVTEFEVKPDTGGGTNGGGGAGTGRQPPGAGSGTGNNNSSGAQGISDWMTPERVPGSLNFTMGDTLFVWDPKIDEKGNFIQVFRQQDGGGRGLGGGRGPGGGGQNNGAFGGGGRFGDNQDRGAGGGFVQGRRIIRSVTFIRFDLESA
jgi:hypothetical protein